MATKQKTLYQKELANLKRRMKTLEKKGYTFDEFEFPISARELKNLRGEKLIRKADNMTPQGAPINVMNLPQVDIIGTVRNLIRDFEAESYDLFYPSKDGKTFAQVTVIVEGLLSFFDDLTINMTDEEQAMYEQHLLQNENEISTLLTFQGVKYLDEVSSKKAQLFTLLNWGETLTSEQAYRYSGVYNESTTAESEYRQGMSADERASEHL